MFTQVHKLRGVWWIYHAHGVSGPYNTRKEAIENIETAVDSCDETAPSLPNPVRVVAFEQALTESQIKDFQKVSGLAVDGRFTEKTRNAILAFLKSKNLKDQHFPDLITAKDGVQLRRILEEGPHC